MAKKPVDWDQLFPNRFLKSGELLGKQVTLTISSVDTDELENDDGNKKTKGIVSFGETRKQLALNKTNGICLREMFGRKLSEWVGKRVTIYPTECRGADGKMTACIRVWGSPDIEQDVQATIQLPRRKPQQMTLRRVASDKDRAAHVDRQPGDEG